MSRVARGRGARAAAAPTLVRASRRLALALLAFAQLGAAPEPPVAVYGAELFDDGATERLLVFASRPVEARVEVVEPGRIRVWIEGAVLDDSAPRRLAPRAPREVARVELSEAPGATKPMVRIEITGSAALGLAALSREQALLAVEIPLRGPPPGDGIVLSLRETPLPELVRTVADATGMRFVFDERLEGRVTLSAPAPVTAPEALALLDSALALAGFAAVPAPDGSRRILPADLGAAMGALAPEAGAVGRDEAPIVTLVRLRAARAEEALSTLRPWLGGALVHADAPGNAVLLAGPEARLHGILAVLRALDEAAGESLWVHRPRQRAAGELAEWLRMAEKPAAGERARAQIWSDAASNALIVRAPQDELDEIRARVARLDRAEAQDGALRVLRVRHADPQALAERLRGLAADAAASEPGATLAARALHVALDAPTRSLLVAADAETQAIVEGLVRELDRPPRRVSVEAIVLEIESDESLAVGFDALLPLTSPRSASKLAAALVLDPTGGGLLQPGAGGGPAGAVRYSRAVAIPIVDASGNPTEVLVPRETFVATADAREIRSRVLLRPHLLVASGEEQEIFAGDEVPIPVSASTAAEGALDTRQAIERQDVGVRLRVRPTLGEEGPVRLDLDLEVSRVSPGIVPGGGVGPVLRQRRVQSTIRLADGEVAVVGLGREIRAESTQTGTPYLKDTPGIGALFRATRDARRAAEVVIAVRARVLRDDAELAADGIRRRLGVERSLARLGPLGADTATPWAVLAATREDAAAARALAGELAREGFETRVVEWSWEGATRRDVYATGFADLADAASAASRLAARGLSAELVPLPVPVPGG